MSEDRLYFRQLLAGRDFAPTNGIAAQMVNFCYLIGDRQARQCVVVDPAWDVRGLAGLAEADDMSLSGALVTHYHPDHVGGDLFGHHVEGLAQLAEIADVPIHCHRDESRGIAVVTGVPESELVKHEGGDTLKVGEVEIEFLHTPGHTPGSQCFLVDGRLVSGDTLFTQGWGRFAFPGGDAGEMYTTLTQRLSKLPEDTVLFPGHHYGTEASLEMETVRQTNYMLQPQSLEDWLRLMG